MLKIKEWLKYKEEEKKNKMLSEMFFTERYYGNFSRYATKYLHDIIFKNDNNKRIKNT